MNIVLIGMRGSGKSTIGKLLAKKLNRKFIETDNLIVEKAGMSIPNIVKRYGWKKFRQLENAVVKKIYQYTNHVIATGGGVILKEENVKLLKKNGFLIWLIAKPETLINRIGNDPNRPSLTGKSLKEDIQITLKERLPLYQRAADSSVTTDNKSPDEIVKLILKIFSQKDKGNH